MLDELKRSNSIGNLDGFLFLISILQGKDYVSIKEIFGRCSLEESVSVNCRAALGFLEYIGFAVIDKVKVCPTAGFRTIENQSSEKQINLCISACIKRLAEDGVFDADKLRFDSEYSTVSIRSSAFPLKYASIRNFLIQTSALNDKIVQGEILVENDYEQELSRIVSKRRAKLSLQQLLEQKQEQMKRGLEAEEFVLAIEKGRNPSFADRIKRISDFDVTAGYDIVSFESQYSGNYDRFIEVKSFIGDCHFFWSDNEAEVAKTLGANYLLCLVDYKRISEEGYSPEYIINPHKEILSSDEWLVDTATYSVRKIGFQ